MTELASMLRTMPGLHLVGSAYHGVGLPDLIREGRAVARSLVSQEQKETPQLLTGWNG
jgi:oxygen-dependent protoporphyrinogen oxidase